MNKNNIILDWQCGVGLFLTSLFFMSLLFDLLISFLLGSFPIHFLILIFFFVVLGGSIIVCRSIQRHIVALELDIDVFKSILLPIRKREQKHTSQYAFLQQGSDFAPPPRKMAKRNFDLLCA